MLFPPPLLKVLKLKFSALLLNTQRVGSALQPAGQKELVPCNGIEMENPLLGRDLVNAH